MTNGNDSCGNCGGDKAIHHYLTDQCPVGGVEAPVGKEQEWKTSTTFVGIPFDPPSRLAKDMTIREYFAAMAMQGFAAADTKREVENEHLAAWSVGLADLLIAELNAEATNV